MEVVNNFHKFLFFHTALNDGGVSFNLLTVGRVFIYMTVFYFNEA